jgi:peroxiredoxin
MTEPNSPDAAMAKPRTWKQKIAAEARSWAVTLLIVACVWMVVQSLRGGVKITGPAPDFAATTLDGREVKLSALRGHPVVLYFTASWCPVCKVTSPTVDRFAAGHPDVTVLGIAAEDADAARAYLQANPRSFQVLVETRAIDQAYQVRALPTTVVIDAHGQITWSRQGALLPFELELHTP